MTPNPKPEPESFLSRFLKQQLATNPSLHDIGECTLDAPKIVKKTQHPETQHPAQSPVDIGIELLLTWLTIFQGLEPQTQTVTICSITPGSLSDMLSGVVRELRR